MSQPPVPPTLPSDARSRIKWAAGGFLVGTIVGLVLMAVFLPHLGKDAATRLGQGLSLGLAVAGWIYGGSGRALRSGLIFGAVVWTAWVVVGGIVDRLLS